MFLTRTGMDPMHPIYPLNPNNGVRGR
jgi:hypothetical protein